MFEALIKKVPLQKKIELGFLTLGLNSPEKLALDRLVKAMSINPFVSTIVGRDFSGIVDLIVQSAEYINDPESALGTIDTSVLSKFLSNPAVRKKTATAAYAWIKKQKDAGLLISALGKLAEFPIDGLGDKDFENVEHFIAEGALKTIGDNLPSNKPIGYAIVVGCPYCEERFMHNV